MKHGDPDELVEQVTDAVCAANNPVKVWQHRSRELCRRDAIAAIEAVYAYQATHGALSDPMNADWWVEPPRDGEI